VETTYADFCGIYSPKAIAGEDQSLLYMGASNTLYYPSAAMNINACRGYFQLNGITAGDAHTVRLFFGNDEDTGVATTNFTNYTNSDAWYTLDGRIILNSQSSNRKLPKGVYIYNGRKQVIK
jgi:hypothetical protein